MIKYNLTLKHQTLNLMLKQYQEPLLKTLLGSSHKAETQQLFATKTLKKGTWYLDIIDQ